MTQVIDTGDGVGGTAADPIGSTRVTGAGAAVQYASQLYVKLTNSSKPVTATTYPVSSSSFEKFYQYKENKFIIKNFPKRKPADPPGPLENFTEC